MHRNLAHRLGTLGVVVALIGLGIPGEHASGLGNSQAITRADRVGTLTEGLFRQQPVVSTPMLWGVQWTDAGPAGVRIDVKADAVSRRPRRVGPLTFESFQEVVATRVQVRIVGQRHAADRDRKDSSAFKVFSRLQGRLAELYAMARGGLHAESDPARLFTRTFLSGVVFEDLVVETVRDTGGDVGRLRSQTMSAAPGGSGWNLQGLHVEATDGRRLTIHEGTWSRNGRLVARGPYVLEENRQRGAGPDGCFLIDIRDTVAIRGPIMGDEDTALCVPNPLQGKDSLGLSAMSTDSSFLPLPMLFPQKRGDHRAARLKPWLLSIMTTGSQQVSQSH